MTLPPSADTAEPSPGPGTIGPVFTARSLAQEWQIAPHIVTELIAAGQLLAMTTADGVVVIPRFQLDNDLRLVPALADIVQLFPPSIVDRWTLASWLTRPQVLLGMCSITEHILAGRDTQASRAVAEAARDRWAA